MPPARLLFCAGLIAVVAGCSRQDREDSQTTGAVAPATAVQPAAAPSLSGPARTDAPAGIYKLDKTHASLVFRVDHLGLSNYTARFTGLDGELQLDPANPGAASITATVDSRSLETDYPNTDVDFDRELQGGSWLDAARFPKIAFKSTKVEMTGPDTARVTGDLALHGVTRSVVLETRFNGGYASNAMDPAGSRVGFSAKGALKRSDFGVAYGIPPPGTTMGVGDPVEFQIEAEFVRPAAAAPSPAAAPADPAAPAAPAEPASRAAPADRV